MPTEMKIVSSLEKCFLDEKVADKAELFNLSAAKNEKTAFQVIVRESDINEGKKFISLRLEGEIKDNITIFQVESVPSAMPVYPNQYDDNYLRTEPGLYPDLITKLRYNGRINFLPGVLFTFWAELDCKGINPGKYPLKAAIVDDDGNIICESEIQINVMNFELPECDIYHTEWFHCDCLASYYHTEVFSQKHWEIVENFLKEAADNGMNTVLTPVITPPLDTAVGGERLTCQLVDVYRDKGKYSFGFEKLDRWIEMCSRVGIKYFETSPIYTQWGASAAPKVIAVEDGEEKKIFGWDTDCFGDEYQYFLSEFLHALSDYFKSKNLSDRVLFHISDEPNIKQLDAYKKGIDTVKKYLPEAKIIDAVSDPEVYTEGGLENPVVVICNVPKFEQVGAENAWAYYCCWPAVGTTNRFMSMPSARTRILGVQLYKYKMKGFLHWGYNFYNNQYSYDAINPYSDTTGGFFAPSGDAFLVYPGADGKPEASLRLKAMRDAFNDYRALKLCEQKNGREFTLNLIREDCDGELTTHNYPKNSDYLINLREKVYKAIEE